MATPKEQHDTRHGRVTGTDWERRRELELARTRALGLDPAVAADAGPPAATLPDDDLHDHLPGPAPSVGDPLRARGAAPPIL